MRLLRDSVSLTIILIMLLLCGCNIKDNQYNDKYLIEVEDIYNQIDNEYYVYFYKDDCPYCDDVFNMINKYLKITEDNDYTKLYICYLSDKYLTSYNIYYEDKVTTIKIFDNQISEYDSNVLQLSKNDNEYICEFNNGEKDSFTIDDNNIEIKKGYISKIIKSDEEIISSVIKRVYNGENGQGAKGTYFVDGVSRYEDLYISGVPSLIKINNEGMSNFVVSGRKDILEYFEKLLKDK